MSKPPNVRILGQRITVKVVTDVNKALGEPEHEGERSGNANLRFGIIHLERLQSADQLADTYLHELLHIMLMMVGHDDEATVFRVAPVMLDFLRKNPKAIEYLTRRDA